MRKTVVITGTSTGFGKITAQTLAKSGYDVVATMRAVAGKNKAAAEELVEWAGISNVSLEVVELDVTSDTSVQNAVASILERHSSIDVVINNAGIYSGGITESFSTNDFKRMYEVNVFGSLRVVNAILPAMRKSGNGLFVQISSIMGRFVLPFSAAYTSSKWAVEAIAESLRYDLAPLGIDSVIVQPGAFQTDIFQNAIQPENPTIAGQYAETSQLLQTFSTNFKALVSQDNLPNQPQDVASAILKLIETPAGQRPQRVVVDKMMNGLAEPVNEAQDKVQHGLLANLGLASLLQTRSESTVAV